MEELKIAQEELSRCSGIFWTQARFFLTINTALIAIVTAIHVYAKAYQLAVVFIGVLGICISIMWLLHGNRIVRYLESTEECIIKLEQELNLYAKTKTYQYERFKRDDISFLERYHSTKLIKTCLPLLITLFWIMIILGLIFLN